MGKKPLYNIIVEGWIEDTPKHVSEKGRWCYIITDSDYNVISKGNNKNAPNSATTTQRMTFIALLEALKALNKEDVRIHVYTNSIHLMAVIYHKAKRLDKVMSAMINEYNDLAKTLFVRGYLIKRAAKPFQQAFKYYWEETKPNE